MSKLSRILALIALLCIAGLPSFAQNYIVGTAGTLLITPDQGKTWRQLVLPSGESPRDVGGVWQFGPDTVLIATNNGTNEGRIFRSVDAGQTWTLQGESSVSKLDNINFFKGVNSAKGFAHGSNITSNNSPTELLSADSGTNFTNASGRVAFSSLAFDETAGIAIGSRGAVGNPTLVWRTNNAGNSWTENFNPLGSITKVLRTNDTTIFAIGTNGLALRSTDNGQTFQTFNDLFGFNFQSELVIDVTTNVNRDIVIVTAGARQYAVSTDSGQTFEKRMIPASGLGIDNIRSTYIKNDGTIYTTGQGSNNPATRWVAILVSSDTGRTFTRLQRDLNQVPNIEGVARELTFAPSQNVGYALRASNSVMKTTDGGATWNDITRPTTDNSYDGNSMIVFDDNNLIISVDQGNSATKVPRIFRSSNGGASWSTLIQFAQNDEVFSMHLRADGSLIGTRNGRLSISTDSGATWNLFSNVNTDINPRLNSWADGFVAGVNGHAYLSTDGNLTWTRQFTQPFRGQGLARDVVMPTSQVAYLSGNQGTIFKSTNAGLAWNNISLPLDANFTSLHFLNADTAFVASQIDGLLGKTVDGGQTWDFDTLAIPRINSIVFSNDTIGFVLGNNGWLLRTEDAGDSWTRVYTGVTSNLLKGTFKSDIDTSYGFVPVAITLDSIRAAASTTVAYPVLAGDVFNNVTRFNATLQFDPLVVNYNGVSAGPVISPFAASNVNTAEVANGLLTFNFNGPDPLGYSGNPSDTLFFINFDVVGNPGDSTAITFMPMEGMSGARDASRTTRELTISTGQIKLWDIALTTGEPMRAAVCIGETIKVPFTKTGAEEFMAGNTFEVQLSQNTSFATPITVQGTLLGTDTLEIMLPVSLPTNQDLYIRVVSTMPMIAAELSDTTVRISPFPVKPNITPLGATQNICDGSTVTLSAPATGAAIAGYLWSNGETTQTITVGMAGKYAVQVLNATECASPTSDTVEVIVNPVPTAAFTQTGNRLTATPSGAQFSYQWMFNGSNIPGATLETYDISQSGDYQVIVRQGLCADTSVLQTITSSRRANNVALSVYPNPNKGSFTADLSALTGTVSLQVMDMTGRVVYTQELNGGTAAQVNLPAAVRGMYQVRVQAGEQSATRSIVVQ